MCEKTNSSCGLNFKIILIVCSHEKTASPCVLLLNGQLLTVVYRNAI